MIKIGYYHPEDNKSPDEFLMGCTPERVPQSDSDFLRRCPSTSVYRKNTFVVRAPYTLEFEVESDGKGQYQWQIDMESTTLAMSPNGEVNPQGVLNFTPDGLSVQTRPCPNYSYVSDTKGVILLQHMALPSKNPPIINGMIDIYKWPDRALSVGYELPVGKTSFSIKKGEPWYFITFITPEQETVKLVRQIKRHPFLLKSNGKDRMSAFFKLNWREQFNFFGKMRPKKLILE